MRIARLVSLFVFCAATMACTYATEPWRLRKVGNEWKTYPEAPLTDTSTEEQIAQQSWEQRGAYDLGIIEFDDRGHVWSAEQEKLVLDHIRNVARNGVTMIVYAHGWHHNAAPHDGNIDSFRKVLATIAAQNHIGMTCGVPTPEKNRVVGVYIGWRGESSDNKLLKWFTIWGRKQTAQRIGGASTAYERLMKYDGSLPYVLNALDLIRLEANEKITRRDERFSSLTIVGHSLGGAMLLSSMQQLVFRSERPHYKTKDRPLIQGVGDLVVLLNPAVEARRYGYFEAVVSPGATFESAQAPVLITVSSKGDWQNKWPFWIARFFSTVIWPPRWLEPVRSTVNLGWRSKYKTHELTLTSDTAGTLDRLDPFTLADNDFYPQGINPSSTEIHLGRDLAFYGHQIQYTRRQGTSIHEDAPFLIVQGTEAIIEDHNDIFSNRLLAFLLPFSTATERKRVNTFCAGLPAPPAAAAAAAP